MITATITMIAMIRAVHCCSAVSLSLSLFLTLTCKAHACEITNNSKTQFFLFQHAVILNPSVLHIGNSNMAAGRMHRRHQINIHQKSPGWRQHELLLCAIHMLASSQGWKSLLLNNKMCIKINEKSVKEEREIWKKQEAARCRAPLVTDPWTAFPHNDTNSAIRKLQFFGTNQTTQGLQHFLTLIPTHKLQLSDTNQTKPELQIWHQYKSP